MQHTIPFDPPYRIFLYRLFILIAPPAAIAFIAIGDATLGAMAGFMLGMLLSARSPLYGVPVILVAAALNNIAFIFGLHFGWILIAGCAAGALVHALLGQNRLRMEATVLLLILVFVCLEVGGALFANDGRLDRLIALLSILTFLGLLSASCPELTLQRHFQTDASRAFIYLTGTVGIILILVTLSMLSSQEFRLSRAGELGLAIGETESSPRSLSNILGIVLVVCLSSVISFPAKAYHKLVWGAMGLAALVGMLYTGSRMPVLASAFGLAVALIVQLIFLGRKLRVENVILAAIGFLLMVIFITSIAAHGPGILPFIDEGVSNFRIFRTPTIESNTRLDMWVEYYSEASVLQLLFGSGIGAMGNPHSLYVGTLAAFGLVGLIALLLFIINLVVRACRVRSTVAIAVLAYTLLALSSSSDVDKSYFWVMCSVIIVAIRVTEHKNTSL